MVTAQYRQPRLIVESQSGQHAYEYEGGFYILASSGWLKLSAKEDVQVRVGVGSDSNWYSSGAAFRLLKIESEPLTLGEIYEIYQKVGLSDTIGLSWHIDAYGFLDEESYKRYGIPLGQVVRIEITSSRGSAGYVLPIARQQFVRDVLQQADMLERHFVEVVMSPIDEELLKKIKDDEISNALEVLLNKQKVLQEALEKLYEARTSSDYEGVILKVRQAIEGLVSSTPTGRTVSSAVRKAFEGLRIAEELGPGALSELASRLSEILLGGGSEGGLVSAIFHYTSELVHATGREEPKKMRVPKPYEHDAEFAVLQAMVLLNYLIKVLESYALRS